MDKQAPVTTENEPEFRIIGTRPIRNDGVDKVTGRALYGADVRFPGMLYGYVLRSPYAHARIVSIDTSLAERMPGVKAIVTSQDLPELESRISDLGEGFINLRYQSCNVLARGKVLYFGHPVAAVAATSFHLAEEACQYIKVSYELLEPVMDVIAAMDPASPILLDDLYMKELGNKTDFHGNIADHFQSATGDIEQGFAQAEVVIEREFTTSMVHQGYIEPQNATAIYNPDNQITIWTSTQGSFGVRDQVAEILEIPVSRIKVVPMEIGGGFGGKIGVYLEPLAVLLSKKSGGKHVKLTMNRSEVFAATGPTSGSFIRVKMGAKKDGHITAAQAFLAYEAGAFPGSSVYSGGDVLFAPYAIPNMLIDGYDVVVNKPRTAAYRAPGGSNANFASETVIDELAVILGLDPIKFRLINAAKEGDRNINEVKYGKIGNVETMQTGLSHPHYSSPLGGKYHGRGVAVGFWGNYGGTSSASASVNSDGSISLATGSVDIGGSRISAAMQLAEVLCVPVEAIRSQVVDTDSVGYTEGTYGSRTTFATGWAVYEVGRKLIGQLKERAAILWDLDVGEVDFKDGIFSSGDQHISLVNLVKNLDDTGGPVTASVGVRPESSGPGFTLHIVDIAVDPDTGKIQILRYTAIQDVGKAIHPDYVEGQIQGGVAQGIGWALNEEYVYGSNGVLLNSSFLDYRMPTALDLPLIESVLVEVPNPGHPYGVRGVGEVPIVPPPAAIANAIFNAVGVRMRHLPMSPQVVLKAIKEKQIETM